jgi:SAM-dependent methyltransferase
MRSLDLSLDQYDTDKVASRYLEKYDPVLVPWLDKRITLLELGIRTGGSLLLWRDYFPLATIVGVDIDPLPRLEAMDRIHMYQGSQADPEFLTHMAREIAPDGFDIIIDDASHLGELTKAAFWHLFEHHLKPGGLYVIEDWGTGYWDDWLDGKTLDLDSYARPQRTSTGPIMKLGSKLRGKIPALGRSPGLMKLGARASAKSAMPGHSYGMVGFVKQLVDEQGAADVTRRLLSGTAQRNSKFESLLITPSIVFVRKASGAQD